MERRLAAIVVADMVGYSRLMEIDEAGTLAALQSHRAELIDLPWDTRDLSLPEEVVDLFRRKTLAAHFDLLLSQSECADGQYSRAGGRRLR